MLALASPLFAQTADEPAQILLADDPEEETVESEIAEQEAIAYASVNRYNEEMIDLRFKLKEHIDREEWEIIIPGD